MKRLEFSISIRASKQKVYDVMLGITHKKTYEAWTAIFNPTSTYNGQWTQGSKMLFLGSDEFGEQGGMVSEIAEMIPGEMVSIRHYGLYKSGEEITEGPEVDKWAGGIEQYVFKEEHGLTTVTVHLDSTDEFVDYMNDKYPKALEMLKRICEE